MGSISVIGGTVVVADSSPTPATNGTGGGSGGGKGNGGEGTFGWLSDPPLFLCTVCSTCSGCVGGRGSGFLRGLPRFGRFAFAASGSM